MSLMEQMMQKKMESESKIQSKPRAKKKSKKKKGKKGATLTYSYTVENHVGMEILGDHTKGKGKTVEELLESVKLIKERYPEAECYVKILNDYLPEGKNCEVLAGVLVFKDGVNHILRKIGKTSVDLFNEHDVLEKDTKYFDTRRQKVLNKHARHNLCFKDEDQEPDYENKKGTVVSFNRLPLTKYVREEFEIIFGEKDLNCEGNYYYDLLKTGIGFHGDSERLDVYGTRIGEDNESGFPLHFQWYQNRQRIGERCIFDLKNGDIYSMSKKATGYDWKKSANNILTLRHAAGCDKYLK